MGQSAERLLQKLEALAITFAEEEKLTLVEVAQRVKKAFDVKKVTKKFFTRFEKEHGQFLKFIDGIQSEFDRTWYASLMLNRLMFISLSPQTVPSGMGHGYVSFVLSTVFAQVIS